MASPKFTVSVAMGALLVAPAMAQTTPPEPSVDPITVAAKSAPVLEPELAHVSGFSPATVRNLAQSIAVFSKDALTETATSTLSNLTRLDASLADAYNTTGYNQSLSVRGFVLDNFYNFRRQGLPVLNIGPLALENKANFELLKGVSGMLSGVSAPGGLLNTTVARADGKERASATLHTGERGTAGVAAFANILFDQSKLRLDASAQQLRPLVHNARGERQFASLAFDTAFGGGTLALDLEAQRFSQPSVPGVSPLDTNGDGVGDFLPTAQPRLNLNAQPWTQPFQTQSSLAALRWSLQIVPLWRLHLAAQTQRVRTNDRVAFPDGCSNATTYVYPGFCGNGDFDLYDFRSDNERRTLNVLDAYAQGHATLGEAKFSATFGAQWRKFTQRAQPQAYNYAGSGNVFAPIAPVPAAPEASTPGTHLDESSVELYAHAHGQLGSTVHGFIGARATRLTRASVRTDGSERSAAANTVFTPWIGASWSAAPNLSLYAGWGQGVQSEIVPNRPQQYTNYGAALPALKSAQAEFGLKWQATRRLLATAAAFEIRTPYADDEFGVDGRATRVVGAKRAVHRGVELSAAGKLTPWLAVHASAAWLDAKYTAALNEALIGKRVTNIPRGAMTLFADAQIPALPGFALNALLSAQTEKAVSADNTLNLPKQAQLDLGLRYTHTGSGQRTTWRLNVENVTNRTGWREAPTQPWGGVYLFTSPQRAVRASVTVTW